METAAVQQEPEETEEKAAAEPELELDLENPYQQQVMRANSCEIQKLVLTNGTSIDMNTPWLREDGATPAYPLFDKETGKPALDENQKPRFLKVGAIFFVEETTTTTRDEDDDELVSVRTPAHYEVWTEPGAIMRRQRFFLDQVAYAEEAVPAGWAADQIMTDRLPESLVLDTKEVIEAAKKLEAGNGSSEG
jgi:hypothetical protein